MYLVVLIVFLKTILEGITHYFPQAPAKKLRGLNRLKIKILVNPENKGRKINCEK